MIEYSIIFKLAGLGICISIINTLLEKANASEWKFPISMVGVIMGLFIVMQYIKEFFQVVQTFAS